MIHAPDAPDARSAPGPAPDPAPNPLAPTGAERAARARTDLRCGLPVAVGGLAVAAVETLGPARWAALAPGAVLALTARRAATLRVRAYDGDLARVAVPAGAGLDWARAMADPARDLATPLKAPVAALRGDGPEVAAARAGIALAKAAHLLPAVLLAPLPEGAGDLTALSAAPPPPPLAPERIVSARVPLAAAETASVHVFRPPDGRAEHHAVRIGAPDPESPVLARLHSACFTGDVLGSLKCDCGPQLDAALRAMAGPGGVLLYLNQEGRGIGLANKMRAYALQDQGFDTVEANHRTGFEDDERDFAVAAGLLRGMGIGRVRLLTNNPAKIAALEAQGIEVAERVPLHVGRTRFNAGYLATKRAKSGHLE